MCEGHIVKKLNDNLSKEYGQKARHLSGDELLRLAGERFEKMLHEQDCVCHIGGDECEEEIDGVVRIL